MDPADDVSHSKSKLSEQRRRHPKFSRYKAAQSKTPSEKRDLLIIKKKQQHLETKVKVSTKFKEQQNTMKIDYLEQQSNVI